MAVLNDIRALFAQCPALKDLEARTDQLETDAEGYGIFPAGSVVIEQDMRGAATWQYNFIIAATRMTADDITGLGPAAKPQGRPSFRERPFFCLNFRLKRSLYRLGRKFPIWCLQNSGHPDL